MNAYQTIAALAATHRLDVRLITGDDLPLLCRIYAGTREDELALVDWSAAQKAAFVEMQFTAQHRYYQEHYPHAAFWIVERAGQPVGRLYLHQGRDELRIVDVALLPAFRNQGIGSTLLHAILSVARQIKLPVRIHVERFNPALRLYSRLGFRPIADRGVYLLLERPVDDHAPDTQLEEERYVGDAH